MAANMICGRCEACLIHEEYSDNSNFKTYSVTPVDDENYITCNNCGWVTFASSFELYKSGGEVIIQQKILDELRYLNKRSRQPNENNNE